MKLHIALLLVVLFSTIRKSLETSLDCPSGTSRSALSVTDPQDAPCPANLVTNYTVTNLTIASVNITLGNISLGNFVELDGYMGYCFSPPIPVSGYNDPATGSTFNTTHHITIVMQIPWCFASFAFNGPCGIVGGRYASYPSYFGPAVVINERPIQQECLNYFNHSTNTSYEPFPLWDQGGDTLGTIRLAINDSCAFNASNSLLNRPLFVFLFLLTNGSFSISNRSVTNSTNSSFIDPNNYYTNSSGHYLYASYADVVSGPTTSGKWCTDQCDTLPQPTCLESPRTIPVREIYRQRTIVSLSCKDSIAGFGFVWRVDNLYSFGVHTDWFIRDIIQNVNLPIATNTSYVNMSRVNASLNIGFNNPLYNGFWPNVAGKRRIGSGQYFYIPTYTPSANASISLAAAGIFRPTYLDFYAGYPSHYTGTTTLAGIVDFFDMRTYLNMSAFIQFNASIVGAPNPGQNATYRDKNVTTTIRFNSTTLDLYVPKDYDRQVILAICIRADNVTATVEEIISITNVTGWTALCDHIRNESKTWPQTLDMLYNAFPGILASNTSDPIPQCNCSNEDRSPCTTGGTNPIDTPGQVPNMMKLYTPGSSPLRVNASVTVLCRITPALLENISTTINTPTMAVFIYNATQISNGDYGYVWKIRNDNIDSTVQIPGLTPIYINTINDLYTRWAFGTYVEPSGNANTSYPLPYPSSTGGIVSVFSNATNSTSQFKTHDVSIRSGTTYFFFSLTSQPHKMYGTFQQICSYGDPIFAALFCSDLFPTDPALQPDPFGWVVSADNATLTALPNCTCGVDVPCELGSFLFNIDSNLNLSALEITTPPPGPPVHYNISIASCVPTVELCNGRDDDCDGIIDNIPGLGFVCGNPNLDGIGICTTGILGCPNVTTNPTLAFPAPVGVSYNPICFGGIFPVIEICNNLDDNCDGIVDNISPELCGSFTLGNCQQGVTICVGGTLVCYGEITPISEICGNNIDDDCDGIIDNACPESLSSNPNPLDQALSPIPASNVRTLYKILTQSKNTQSTLLNLGSVIPKLQSYGYASHTHSTVTANVNSMVGSVQASSEPVFSLSLLNDISSYFVSIYTAFWTIILILLLAIIAVSIMCMCGPHGGCCMWSSSKKI
jgi:hypothetical protein